MIKQSAIDTLISNAQSEMSRVGGKLAGLNAAQNWGNSRNNTIDGDYTPHKEGTEITMSSNTAQKIVSENSNPEVVVLPPAGGAVQEEIAKQVFAFMSQASGLQKVAPPRSWKEKAFDQAIPTLTTVATVVAVQGLISLIGRGVSKYQAKKQLAAAAKAEQLLSSGSQNVA